MNCRGVLRLLLLCHQRRVFVSHSDFREQVDIELVRHLNTYSAHFTVRLIVTKSHITLTQSLRSLSVKSAPNMLGCDLPLAPDNEEQSPTLQSGVVKCRVIGSRRKLPCRRATPHRRSTYCTTDSRKRTANFTKEFHKT